MDRGTKIKYVVSPLLICLLSLPLSNSFSQNLDSIFVSIKSSGKELHQVLDDLSNQCSYNFTFDSRLINSNKKIYLAKKQISLNEAIDSLFNLPALRYKIIHKNIVIYSEANVAVADSISDSTNIGWIKVKGIVVDKRNGKALPFATITLMDSYIGTITNEDGTFSFRIKDSIKNPVLVTSYIGYSNSYTPISTSSEEIIEIKLSKDIISLQEVIIRYQDPGSLLQSAVNSITENYIDKPSGAQAYYREKVLKDENCMIFSEVVVEIAKNAYGKSDKIEKSRILKGRKISNIDNSDTVVVKIRSGVNTILQLDIINNLPDFLSEGFEQRYDLNFSDLVSYKDKLVYVVSFKQKEHIAETLFKGEVYIDRETLTIIAADFEYNPDKIGREQNMFVAKKSKRIRIHPTRAKYHVEYKNSVQGYFLSQVHAELNFKIRKKRQWIASKYQIKIEMAITDINPNETPVIKNAERLKSSSVLSDQYFKYDPEFWGDYNTIAPEEDLIDALKKIKKAMLEIQ